jgi:activator of HSP90 ATPase
VGAIMKTIKTKNLKQGAMFRATPHEVYELLMDSKKHSAFSGAEARISRKEGGSFSAYDGWCYGKNLKLVKDKMIVQTWRGDDWPKGHYSTVKFMLKRSGTGTKLMFSQTGIPEDLYSDISDGWKEHYWEKMKAAIKS